MEFDIKKFAKEFKKIINWMLKGRYGKEIREGLQSGEYKRTCFKTNPDHLDALLKIIDLLVTRGWRLRKPKDFDTKIGSFLNKHRTNFRTSRAKTELFDLVGQGVSEKIENLLTNYSTIEEFTKRLYELAKRGDTDVLGEKGRDDYLREFGYWDRIPMDRHEMRFIIRTGIYHACSSKDRSDHLTKSHLQDALTRFCDQYLRGCVVEGIDLGRAPGIVDAFIWSYCGRSRYNMCRKIPNCEECNLKGVCLYVLTNFR